MSELTTCEVCFFFWYEFGIMDPEDIRIASQLVEGDRISDALRDVKAARENMKEIARPYAEGKREFLFVEEED